MSLLERIRRAFTPTRTRPSLRAGRGADRRGKNPDRTAPDPQDPLSREVFERMTGLPVRDLGPYVHAMRHRSLLRGRPGSDIESNERLEYLGDAVLGFVTAEHLYRTYPREDEGFLTRLRAKLVNGKALARSATAIGLDALILVSDNLQQQGHTRQFTSIMADAFEALIGAIYVDQGMEAASHFIHEKLLGPLDLDDLMAKEDNPKSLLLEFAQARGWPQPAYRVVEASGPSHRRWFTVEVVVAGVPRGTGQAGSKKQAEQLAAGEALELLREEAGEDFETG